MSALAPSNLQLDILMGRDETIEAADIFGGEFISRTAIDSYLTLKINRHGDRPNIRLSQGNGKEAQHVITLE